MNPFHEQVSSLAVYSAEKMGKATVARGERVLVGLNAFEAGQTHALHSHEGMDKLYFVLEGTGEFQVGDDTRVLGAGALICAPDGVPHGVVNPGPARLLLLVFLSPPPA